MTQKKKETDATYWHPAFMPAFKLNWKTTQTTWCLKMSINWAKNRWRLMC